jgi:two-component system, chemotaxis family, chemotaxis protein CheY
MSAETQKPRILIVDDFEIVRIMLRNALANLGHTVVDEAEDGKIALQKIQAAEFEGNPYTMVFCDWNMPNMTGIEVLETVRKNPVYAKLPIIMVTAEAEQKQVVQALRSGATDYIVKPIAPEILEKKVTKILSKLASGNAA